MPSPSPSSGYLDGLRDSGIAEGMAFALLALIVIGAAAAWLVWRGARAISQAERPWWGHPLVWAGVSAVFVLLGIFVFPHFFGGVFLFLPLIWLRPRREQLTPPRRCPTCGRMTEPTHTFCPSCGTKVGEQV